jgi:tRNA1(Val) A37 N6-methylase TrmN6
MLSVIHAIRVKLLCGLMKAFRRETVIDLNGFKIIVKIHQTNPIPFSFFKFASFLAHFEQAVKEVQVGHQVLEMGAGCGLWGLLALQKRAILSVSDLVDVDLSSIVESAQLNGLTPPTIYQADLFDHPDLINQRFDHVFFNPPFHFAESKSIEDQAYLGGANGEIVFRFLVDVQQVLKENASVWLILPQIEYKRYASKIKADFHSEIVLSKWVPLLGHCLLLRLKKSAFAQRQALSSNAESFYHLSKMINTHSCELIEIKGKIDLINLKRAIIHVCKQHPITRSKLKNLGIFKGYEWQIDPSWDDQKIDFQSISMTQEMAQALIDFQLSVGQIPPQILSEIWDQKAIDPFLEYPIKFRILMKTQEHAYLMVIAPHLCTDARAGILLVHQILDCYHHLLKGNQLLNEGQCISFIDTLDPLALDEFSFTFRSKLWGYALYGIAYDFLVKAQGLALRHTARGKTCIDTLLIDETQFLTLKQKSKQMQCTIHTLMTMALIKAQKEWKVERGVPVCRRIRLADLYQLTPFFRDKDRLNQSFNMLVAPYTLTLQTESDLQLEITQKLNRLKQGLALVEINRMKIYNFFARFLPISIVQKSMDHLLQTETTTTNPGIIPYAFEWENAEFQVIDVLNFPQIAPPAKLGIIYTTFRGRLRIVFLYDDLAIERDDLLRLQQLLMSYL